MIVAVLTVSTVLTVAWLFLLLHTGKEDWLQAAYSKLLENTDKIEKLKKTDRQNKAKLAAYHGLTAKAAGLIWGSDPTEKVNKLQQKNAMLQKGDLKYLSVMEMPGYVLQRRFNGIATSNFYQNLVTQYAELSGRKYAVTRAKHLLAQMLSYSIIGIALVLDLAALLVGSGNTTIGLIVIGAGVLLVVFLVYALYDDVRDKVKKRRETISRQFPNVVSKLALLVTSGMIMDRAWKETAESQAEELYSEMRKTTEERENLVDPATAYSHFMDRCSTKETTKLASAIISNLTKGNAEIGVLLKNLAHEAWQERRNYAKRDSERANSKLMIPTMLLFLAILVMIMVPIFSSFSSF